MLSQGFLKHVISTAVPCATTMIIYMLLVTFIGSVFHFGTQLLSTYYVLTAGFISFLVVFIVCLPLNRMRTLLANTVTILFYIILLFFYDFFGISSFLNIKVIGLIPICISSIFVIGLLRKTMYYVYKFRYKDHC